MEKENTIKQSLFPARCKELEQNEDDSILGSDELSDLRFSSQDNLLDSSQDGDSQCDVKWDYTSPQTLRQLRKMKGKYCADDVKKIIAKFPDLPVKQPESSIKNITIMLPPRNAAAELEKSRQARAKQREMKLLRQRQRRKQVAKDMILFLQQEQCKHEQNAANRLPVESMDDKKCDKTDGNGDSEKLDEFDDEFWSDDELFRDNSFLIEATQYPEKFFDLKNKNSVATLSSDRKESPPLNPHISKSDQCCEISTTSKNPSPPKMRTSALNRVAFPTAHGGCSENMKVNSKTKGVSISKPSSSIGYSSGLVQSKRSSHSAALSTRGVPKTNVINCDKKPSTSNMSSFPSHKIQTPYVKSPFRKSLSFDAVNNPHKFSAPPSRHVKMTHSSNQNTRTSTYKTSESKKLSSTSAKIESSNNQKQTAEQDLFDSSLSDELLLQATLSQEMAIKCGSSQPSAANTREKKQSFTFSKHSCQPAAPTSSKPATGASNLGVKSQTIKSNSSESISDILLSPVRPAKGDCQLLSKDFSNSPLLSFKGKKITADNPSIPAHMPTKHRSPLSLSSSTPVKCLRPQADEDSFLEKAFEDSFMNDEALFESQILPMLEFAESQVAHKVPCQDKALSDSPVKCSPEEIEQKRQTAIKKRSLRLASSSHRKS